MHKHSTVNIYSHILVDKDNLPCFIISRVHLNWLPAVYVQVSSLFQFSVRVVIQHVDGIS